MPTHRQNIVDTPASVRALGSHDKEAMQTAFASSPIHKGELTDVTMKEKFVKLVQEEIINDGGHTFGTYDPNHPDAPNLAEVVVGGGGLPGSPYAPNIASPGEGNGLNPAAIPAEGVNVTQAARGGGDPFPGNSLASPSDTTKTITEQTIRIGSLKFGTSTPGGS